MLPRETHHHQRGAYSDFTGLAGEVIRSSACYGVEEVGQRGVPGRMENFNRAGSI